MKKFLKNLLLIKTAGQIWNNFTGIRVGISGRPDCPIWASIATGKLPSPFVSPLEKEIFFSETTGQISRKNSQECPLGDPFQILFANFDPSINMALVNGGFLHYTDMKKFLKSLLLIRNRWSDFEIILQESGFDISGCPDCPIRAAIATGKLPSLFVSPPGKWNFWSGFVSSLSLSGPYRRYWYLWDLISKWI